MVSPRLYPEICISILFFRNFFIDFCCCCSRVRLFQNLLFLLLFYCFCDIFSVSTLSIHGTSVRYLLADSSLTPVYVVFIVILVLLGVAVCVPVWLGWLVLSDLFSVACECVYADVCQTKLKFIVIQGTEGEI